MVNVIFLIIVIIGGVIKYWIDSEKKNNAQKSLDENFPMPDAEQEEKEEYDPRFDFTPKQEVVEQEEVVEKLVPEEEIKEEIEPMQVHKPASKSTKINLKDAIIYSEILKPKFKDEESF